jgi:alkanesulfonate monooxygenase SsuD/methylene tetrahydromethanopterin reductase-like flavin-dependent oxidoreductase (luciferase family)
MELGIYSFGETNPRATHDPSVAARRMQELIEEIVLADEVGLDVFGVGEHHRPDYVVSSPAMVLAAAAARTRRIRLTSAVTVLSSDDPVRVFQDFATLDLLSNVRAEITAGRGSFIESYPLFGQNLDDYNELFTEKLGLLLALREQERVTWSGSLRAPIENRGVYPRPLQSPLPVWIAVGGTPESVVRAGTLGLPLAVAIIGGAPERFVPLVDWYRESAERGWPMPTQRQFDMERSARGALLVGAPQQVIDKILFEHELFGHNRMLIQFSVGPMTHADIMRSIELFGTVVAPAVRQALGVATPVIAPG